MLPVLQNLFTASGYLNAGWGSMLAGALLVAAPIIIHLINRMRYRRVRWAAMEFILKAQKKMRRKLIIEQLLLLLLRMLLMLLVGLLVARFIGFDLTGQEARSTQHLVVMDDSPSMGDSYKDDAGVTRTAFSLAKEMLADRIAPAAAEATTPQRLDLMRMSEADNVTQFDRLNATSISSIKSALGQYDVSTVRTDLADVLKKASDRLQATPDANSALVLHVLSDFRSTDWTENSARVRDEVERLTKAGVKVHFTDVAHPFRKIDTKLPQYHDNIGIVEFLPSKAVAARFETVDFTLKVQNFGTSELKDVRFSIRVNGDEFNGGKSVTFAKLPPGQAVTEKFDLTFARSGGADNFLEGAAAGTKLDDDRKAKAKKSLERFNLVTAVLETGEPGGINADNSRHCCLEVRDRLPILVVDGANPTRESKGDSYFLKKGIASFGGGFRWVQGTPASLGAEDLSKYSFVMLLDVPAATLSEAGVANLEKFVRNGGGCGVFLGPLVDGKGDDYTKLLYRDGQGLFPVPLPKDAVKEPTEEELIRQNLNINKKILVRDPAAKFHPALAGIYLNSSGQLSKDGEDVENRFRIVTTKRYFPVRRLGAWTTDPSVQELYCLPNNAKVGDAAYDTRLAGMADKLKALAEDAELAAYKVILEKRIKSMSQAAKTGTELANLIDVLDVALADERSEGDPDEPKLREFWGTPKPDVMAIRTDMKKLRDAMKYGDPLYLAKQFGRGHVTVMLSTAGDAWTDWPALPPETQSFIPVLKEMVSYLSGGGVDDTHACGKPIRFDLDQDNYDPKVFRGFVTHDGRPGQRPVAGTDPAPVVPGEQFDPVEANAKDKTWTVTTADTTKPGVYLFALEQKRAVAGNPNDRASSPEFRFVPVNVAAVLEGDLRRASSDDVALGAPGAGFHSPEDKDWIDKLKNKKTDLSELGWVFLAVFFVLIAEQALAVRLSFHGSTEQQETLAPSAAAALRRTVKQPGPDDAETPASVA